MVTTWDAERYDGSFGFVSALGRGVVELLDPRPDETIIDLGCGTGALTASIAAAGATVTGLDADVAMITKARRDHPGLRFEVADGHHFEVPAPVDAVMSNAALHWMLEPDEVIAQVHAALRPGGRFVAEFGGHGNIATIHTAVRDAARVLGIDPTELDDPWYFPSPAEHATRLETGGFLVRSLELIDRPTPLGDDGVAGWLRMFGGRLLAGVPASRRESVIDLAVEHCRPTLGSDDRWFADYVRLRFAAERMT
jgi:SAM-dependent methyltransferase